MTQPDPAAAGLGRAAAGARPARRLLKRWGWGLLPLAALAIAAARLVAARPIERRPGPEGLEDAAVAAGFAHMAGLPPFRLLRGLVIRRSRALASRDALQHGGAAIDLGCGEGRLAIALARAVPGLHVTGVDLSNELLRDAIANARAAHLAHRVDFRTADAAAVPCPEGAFDLVISSLSLHHWSDPVAVLDEAARLLKKGGAFVIFDLRRDMRAPAYLLLWLVTRWIVPRSLRAAREPLSSRDAAYTPTEAAALAQGARLTGWRIVTGPFWLTIEGRTIV